MLELVHISKTYKTSRGIITQALKDVNLRFPQKGMIFILGKSGSGKSTLLNIIGGLDQADDGELLIHGKSSKTFSQADYDAYRNTYIGFIFQEFYLMEEYTIEKNIALSLQLQQKQVEPQEIEIMLEKVGLAEYGSRYPSELSGGQKQRVAIARSLIKQPQILMADEPTGALDSTTGKEIFDTLKALSKEKLVIVVSHDEEAANQYADRIIRFRDGMVVEDTNDQVEEDSETFVPIKSHLPFKDSFHLGITCLKHKKMRMIFTILLTSFALLTLALSDSVGHFNAVDAQYKAMNDNDEHLVGIRRQSLDEDGNIYMSWKSELLEIHKDKAAALMNEINGPLAKVYDTTAGRYALTLWNMNIEVNTENAYDSACTTFRLTEMNSFADLNLNDVIGTFPEHDREAAISSYLADLMISYGIKDQNGNLYYPQNYEDIIANVSLPIAEQQVKVSAIVKFDLSEYQDLKALHMDQMSKESYNKYRTFSSIVNQNCEQIYVKDGFVKSLNLEKGHLLEYASGFMSFSDQNRMTFVSSLAYPTEAIQYYDGKNMVSTTTLAKDEVIWDINTLSSYFTIDKGVGVYDDSFDTKSEEAKKADLKTLADQIINRKVTFTYNDVPNDFNAILTQEVTVRGVIIPEHFDDGTENQSCYAAKELIEPYITETYYLGELLMSKEKTELKETLRNFPIDKEYSAHTIATNDVNSIQSFAEFATKIFFYASIAFFCFAAILMMNFIVVSINYRKKEIGILRSIGARSMDVVKIFVWEALILATIAYVVTVIVLYALAHVVNAYAMDTIGLLISPVIITFRQPLLLSIIVIAIAFIASFIPILRIARQRPIDAIKK